MPSLLNYDATLCETLLLTTGETTIKTVKTADSDWWLW